mgnify:CR=1 FL=1
MKLRDYLPELPSIIQHGERLASLTNFFQLAKANNQASYSTPTFGIDQIVSSVLRQQTAYRFQMVEDLYTIALMVEEIRAPLNHITSEVFRKGIQWQPKFAVKCDLCGTEYIEMVDKCKQCEKKKIPQRHEEKSTIQNAQGQVIQSYFLKEPDEKQKERFDEFLKDSNIFNQGFEEMMKGFSFDFNAIDDAFLYLSKEYVGGEDIREPVHSKVKEIRKLRPSLVEFDLDQQGLPKNSHFVCYLHRDDSPSASPGICPQCARDLVPAMYIFWHRGSKKYLLDSEIIHVSKFAPSETYGWSAIMTIFEKALTLIGMDKNLYRYFFERRMPASMIMVFTDDPESLRRERADMVAQLRADPNYIPMIAVGTRQNRGRVEHVRLFHTLQEMEYLPVRQEIRERIGAMWGVTPAWQGAPEAFGGLSTQTTQLTVMSRVVEGDQRIFNEGVFPLIMDAFGITDWKLELQSPEEKAEQTEIALAQQRVATAGQLAQMGFDIKIKSTEMGIAEIDFIVSGEAQNPQEMVGGMGGFGGGGMPQGNEMNSQMLPQEGLNLMLKRQPSKGWLFQIMQNGHRFPVVKQVKTKETGENLVWFGSGHGDYVATFYQGDLMGIEKATFAQPPTIQKIETIREEPRWRSEDIEEESLTVPMGE